jgi:hypothetical protein
MQKTPEKMNAAPNNSRVSGLAYYSALIEGILLIFAAILMTISINNLIVGEKIHDIGQAYVHSVIIHWSLSCMLLLLVGIWVLFLVSPLKQLQRRAWWQGILIGLSLIGFGAFFWHRYPSSLHLPGYILLGLIFLVPLVIEAPKFWGSKK